MGEQGTGKHGHKDTAEPYPHHQAGSHKSSEAGSEKGAKGGGGESLGEREYRDEQGNVHHHTKTYEEQHKKGS